MASNLLKEGKKKEESGSTSDRTKMKEFWKFLWQLDCPNKVKQFLWKACKNILPTNHQLASRKVIVEDSCGFCGMCETSSHILWGCKFASEVWKEFLWKAYKNILPTNHRLTSRKVIVEDSCGFCGMCETSGHILWGYKFASELWKELGLITK